MSQPAVPRFRDPIPLVAGAIPMHPSMTAPVARRRPATGLLYLITSGLLWGTGGLTGSLLSRVAGLSAMSVAACRLTAGGVLIVIFLTVTGRRWPAGRAAWARIAMIGVLAALYQSCYFTAVALTSVALATLGMAVLAAAGFATLTLTGARPVPGLDDLTVTGFGFTLGGLVLLPVAAALGGLSFRPGPLTGTVLAALVLGQRLSATGIAGAATLLAAVVVTVRGSGAAAPGVTDQPEPEPDQPEPDQPEPDQPEPDQLACR